MAEDLDQVLADGRGDVDVLRRSGNPGQAEYVAVLCSRFAEATEEYRRKLSLSEAMIRSGLSERTLKRRHRELMDCGLAGFDERHHMWFRACGIPQRAAVVQQRERGRRATA
jgi:hypothetical protein